MSKPKIKIVTGYIPIPAHPRSAKVYGELGDKLNGLIDSGFDIHPFYERVEDTWLWKFVSKLPFEVKPAVDDNVAKNTVMFHAACHQRFEWLLRAFDQDQVSDTFVWLDYGIHSVPGVSNEPIVDFLHRIKKHDMAMPGCWTRLDPRAVNCTDEHPNWRFCGGVIVVPREHVAMFYNATKLMAAKRIMQTHKATFDVNTVARVEKEKIVPLRWYQADHDVTLFTGY